jgi:hypothetical protein
MSQIVHSSMGTVGSSSEPLTKIKDLKSLIELGCIREEINVGGVVFKFRTLSAVERVNLSSVLGNDVTKERIFDFNLNLLANALESVDGEPLELRHPKKDEMDAIKAKVEILAAMQTPVIDKLWVFYNDLLTRCDTQFDAEQIKK